MNECPKHMNTKFEYYNSTELYTHKKCKQSTYTPM